METQPIKIKISSSYTGVISTGSYENAKPMFSAEVEIPFSGDGELADFICRNQKDLQKVCYENFKACEQQAIVERISKERKDFRFYGSFPSVSSIVSWDSDFFVSPEELRQYAAQGNLIDAQCKHYITTNQWDPIEKIEGTWADIVICKKGSLNLPTEGWDFPAFLGKFPLEKMEIGRPVISNKHEFGGTPDIRVCYYEGKKYLADIKRTPDKLKHFKQCAGYVIAEEENGEPAYDGLILIPLNDKTQQGFSKPLVTTEVQQYKKMFLDDRATFRKRFGI